MKNKLLTLGIILLAFSCTSRNQTNTATNKENSEVKSIGGAKDEHGCLVGAGQTWSKLKETCIQVFKEATRLNPIEKKADDAIISAFALVNADASKCEIFLPSGEVSSILLPLTGDKIFSEGDYRYEQKNKTLYFKDKAIYRAD